MLCHFVNSCPGSFDQIAELMGVPSALFIDTYEDDIHSMKLSMLEYVIALQTKKDMPDVPFGAGAGHGNNRDGPKIVLETSHSGFPILPIPLPSQSWNKHDWEQLFTTYMGRHYCKPKQMFPFQMFTYGIDLATGGKSSHLPYADIEQRQTAFIETKYIPATIKIRQPRNMTKPVIQELFQHLSRRQEMDGPDRTLIFKSVKLGKKTSPPQYLDMTANAGAGAGRSTQGQERDKRAAEPRPRADAMAATMADASQTASHQHYDAHGVMSEFGCSEATLRHVGQDIMERLRKTGVAMPVPLNGPADGQPQYAIPCPLYTSKIGEITANRTSTPHMSSTQMIDPSLLTITPAPTPSPTPTPTRPRMARKAKDRVFLDIAWRDSHV